MIEDCGLDKTELKRAMFRYYYETGRCFHLTLPPPPPTHRAYHVLKKIADYMGKSIDNYG